MKNIIIAISIILLVSICTTGCAYQYMNEKEVVCIVEDKWVKRSNNEDIYLVSCGEEVFKITDLFYKGKFNSSNIYAKLKRGKKYKLTVTGYRMGYFSEYQNINDFELIEESKEENKE